MSNKPDPLIEEVKKVLAKNLGDSALRGTIEQGISNELVRQLHRTGFCPICGAEWADEKERRN
jgi:hypothetical protein